MKKNILKLIAFTIMIVFAGYIVATEITGNKADNNLIKCFPDKSLTPENVMRISGCKIVKTNLNYKINTNKIKHVKLRRGTKRHIFIDLDNDGIADDRNL